MSKKLQNSKLHKNFEKKTKAQADKRDKQSTKNDLRRLSHQDMDTECDGLDNQTHNADDLDHE